MKIYFFDTNHLTESDLNQGYNMLDSVKKTRVDNCSNATRRRTIIASDFLTRKMLSSYLDTAPQKIVFAHSSHEKPILPDGETEFNVSHSGNFWVGCVDENPCGIDIEVIRDVNINTTKRFANAEEMEYITSQKNKSIALLEIWTRKEAYFKSIGCGIATVLTAVNVLKQEKLDTKVFDDYIISICGDGAIENIDTLQV